MGPSGALCCLNSLKPTRNGANTAQTTTCWNTCLLYSYKMGKKVVRSALCLLLGAQLGDQILDQNAQIVVQGELGADAVTGVRDG